MALTPGSRHEKVLDFGLAKMVDVAGASTATTDAPLSGAGTAESGSHLWSERYDRAMTDIFALQDEIGQRPG